MEDGIKVFVGEVGVTHRTTPVPKWDGWLDDEYDHDNPDGSESTRRNYAESSYISGVPNLSPAEYPAKWRFGEGWRHDFSVGSPSDPERLGDRLPGS